MTKDAVAGRIRRLLAMADKRAEDLGIPGTEANLTPDMLELTRRRARGRVSWPVRYAAVPVSAGARA